MMKQVVYFEAECTDQEGTVTLEWEYCKDNADYQICLRDLKKKYVRIQIIYVAYNNGDFQDGNFEEPWVKEEQ